MELQNLESIIQTKQSDGSIVYQLRYEWQETHTVKVSLACHTGNLKANGSIAKSHVNHAVYASNRTQNCDAIKTVTKEQAKAAGEWAMSNGRYIVREYLGNVTIYRLVRGEQ